jgi:phosphatidate cytidylyltransferase
MKSRLLTAAVGIPFAIVVLTLGEFFHFIMYIIISALCVLMTFELLSAKKLHKNPKILIPSLFYSFAQPILVSLSLGLLPAFIYLLVSFFVMILFNRELSYHDVAFSCFGTLIITGAMSMMLILPHMYLSYFTYFFVLTIGTTWFADAGAYFSGVFFGKHKLCPRVSPKKTVEGFIGGIIIGTAGAALVSFIFSFIFRDLVFNYIYVLITGFIVSIVSVLGDLTFSLIKRSCDIKDYGSIFPGHGGVLDRFDSVIFTAPLVYYIGLYFPLFTIGKVNL